MRRRASVGLGLLLILSSVGCASLEDIDIPTAETPKLAPFAGPISVRALTVDDEAFRHQGNTTGILGLYDFVFLIPASRKKIEAVAKADGAKGLADFWRAGTEARLRASGGFVAGAGQPVAVSVAVTQAQRDLSSLYWVVIAWIGNPITPLLGQPVGGVQVRLGVECRVRAGNFRKTYQFAYDEESWYGLWWGRSAQRMGGALGTVMDRLAVALRDDLAKAKARKPKKRKAKQRKARKRKPKKTPASSAKAP